MSYSLDFRRKVLAISKHKGLPRPLINEHGEIVASDAWWAAMQSTKVPSKKRTLEN